MFDSLLERSDIHRIEGGVVVVVPETYYNISQSLQFMIEAFKFVNSDGLNHKTITVVNKSSWDFALSKGEFVALTEG